MLSFREVMRCGNATEAARRLNVSQSAISHALARLRDLFGDPLFLRRPHGLEPTRRALALAPRIDALLALAAETMGLNEAFDPRGASRLFRIAAPEFVAALFGARLIEILEPYAPKLLFQCLHLSPEASLQALQRGDVDLALGRFEGLALRDFSVDPLYEDRFCVVARRGHPKVRVRMSAALYERMPHVWAASYSEVLPSDANAVHRHLVTAAIVPHWLTALVLVSTTDVLATCPRRLAQRQAPVLNLRLLDPPWHSPPFTVHVARRRQGRDPGVDWILDRVLEAID